MLDYIIKVLLFQTLFLAVYDLFLKKETFFQWNRTYLIITSLVAYVIPFLKVNQANDFMPTAYQEYIVQLPEVLLSPSTVIKEKFDLSTVLFTALQWIFWIGIIVASILFLYKLYKIIYLIYNNDKHQRGAYKLVLVENRNAFSFFNYIFLGKTLSEENKQQIITHELVHVQQKHSFDLLLFEVQKIVFWFNPFSYLFQRRIAELHEFIADSKAIKSTEKIIYFQNLLNQTFGTHKISFINPFFKISLIKKRIIMLNKSNSKKVLKLKYLLLIPVLLSMLVYSSCEKGQETIQITTKNKKRLVSLYYGSVDGSDVKEIKSKKESYFDVYMLGAKPSSGREISFDDLTQEEKSSYDNIANHKLRSENRKFYSYTIYEMEDGSKAILEEIDWKGMKASWPEKDYSNTDEVPFGVIVNPPIFPGCEDAEDLKGCFNLKVQKYVAQNFDISLAKNLGLDAGKKKIYVKFLISKDGTITNVESRAPHKMLEAEASRLVNGLPKMSPGKTKDGTHVNVTYMLPISFNIE